MNVDDARTLTERLVHQIAPEVDVARADPDAPLQDELDLDSMDFLNLVTSLHEETGLDVPERDYPQLSTLRRFVAYVAAATDAGTQDDQRGGGS